MLCVGNVSLLSHSKIQFTSKIIVLGLCIDQNLF
jgi:hypothetical protein